MAYVYQIINLDDGRIYIGSTKQEVKYRVQQHKNRSKSNINFCMTKDFNFENIKIKILQEFKEYNKKLVLEAEKKFINELNCCNKLSPIQTKEELKEYKKEYNKEYRENNTEKIKTQKYKKILCVCGSSISKNNISRHSKSKYHLNFLSIEK